MNTIIAIAFILSMTVLIIFTIHDFKQRKKEYRSDSTVDSDVYRNIGEDKHVDG